MLLKNNIISFAKKIYVMFSLNFKYLCVCVGSKLSVFEGKNAIVLLYGKVYPIR